MRKILVILLAVISMAAYSENRVKMGDANRTVQTFEAGDTATAGGSNVECIFELFNKGAIQLYKIVVQADSIGRTSAVLDSTDKVPFILSGAYERYGEYFPIDTVDFFALAEDTTFSFESLTTGTVYPLLKVSAVAGDSVTVQLDKIYANFFDK